MEADEARRRSASCRKSTLGTKEFRLVSMPLNLNLGVFMFSESFVRRPVYTTMPATQLLLRRMLPRRRRLCESTASSWQGEEREV